VDLREHVAPEGFKPSQTRQKFRIAMADITAFFITPYLYKAVHKEAPGIHLFFEPTGYAATDLRLLRGELDFAFTIEPPRSTGLKALPLWSDTFVLAARRGHPLLAAKRLTLSAFCTAPHVVINGTGSDEFLDPIDQALAACEMERNVSLTINQFSILPSVLKRSSLISVVPARFARSLHVRDSIDSRTLPLQVPAVVVYLTWHQRNDSSAASTWLRQRLVHAASEVGLTTQGND
jgi:DNA-binding transcriptional LysR family regulator